MKQNTYFDLDLIYDGEDIRAVGYITPYFPATGPSMESAGGDPEEGGEIEDLKLWRRVDGKDVEVEDPDGEIALALQDDIYEGAARESER